MAGAGRTSPRPARCSPSCLRRRPMTLERLEKVQPDGSRVLPRPCPCCGGRMIVIEVFARGTDPDTQLRVPRQLDRHVMRQSLLFSNRNTGRDCRWAWPGYDGARHRRPRRGSNSPPSTPASGIHAAVARPVRLPKGRNYPLAPLCWALAATGVLFKSP